MDNQTLEEHKQVAIERGVSNPTKKTVGCMNPPEEKTDLKYIPKESITPELCKKAVSESYLALADVPKHFITPELCLFAVKQNSQALRHIPADILEELKQLALERWRMNKASQKIGRLDLLELLWQLRSEDLAPKPTEVQTRGECNGGRCTLKQVNENKDVKVYLDAITSVPVPQVLVDETQRSSLVAAGQQLGVQVENGMSNLDIFRNILRAKTEEVLNSL